MSYRSKRYRAAVGLVDRSKQYPLSEAVALTKQTATTKFDGSVELHFRLGIDPKKSEQAVKGTVVLPHGTGRVLKIVVFAKGASAKAAQAAGADLVGDEALIAEVKNTERLEADVVLATPEMMKLLAPIAKALGTRGLMPNPKNETIVKDPAAAIAAWRQGKLTFRNDDTGNVHALVGKTSFSDQQLGENVTVLVEAVKRARPAEAKGSFLKSITLTTAMGPGIRLALS
ncbi:MAG: 50S ribosomal protein L1 [Candidatus Kerfeldbacteria bacterium]|nr:50S ribosomal protein L1 [Candidatus Kerfeldbacteria bacterium]